GDREQAGELVDVLSPLRSEIVADRTTWGGSVAYFLGRLYAFLGRSHDAERALREALDVHERVGALPAIAMTKFALGSVLLGRHPDHGEGTALLREAGELAAPLGVVFGAVLPSTGRDANGSAAAPPAAFA